MDVSVIIVNYNTTGHLVNCLNSLFEYSSGYNFEVIVVDNNSTEKDIEDIMVDYPGVKFLLRNVNNGFGGGCNYGEANANGKYLLFVNPDVSFLSNVNYELLKIMESNPDLAVVSPLYLEDSGNFTFIFKHSPGFRWTFSEAFGNMFVKIFSVFFFKEKNDYNTPFEVDWVMGSFIFVRADIFREVNGFDENMFLYYEDVDLQTRIKALGYKIFYYPPFTIKHLERSSIRSYNGENLYYFHLTRSNLIYMYKHFGILKRNLLRCISLFGILFRILTLPFRRTYRGKRKQKLSQYIINLKQYLSGKNTIYKSQYNISDYLSESKMQIIENDAFWKTK